MRTVTQGEKAESYDPRVAIRPRSESEPQRNEHGKRDRIEHRCWQHCGRKTLANAGARVRGLTVKEELYVLPNANPLDSGEPGRPPTAL
jgi:hypothetical protein